MSIVAPLFLFSKYFFKIIYFIGECLFLLLCPDSIVYDRRTVKNIPKYASAEFYIDNVLPRIKEKKIMALKPFVDRLG